MAGSTCVTGRTIINDGGLIVRRHRELSRFLLFMPSDPNAVLKDLTIGSRSLVTSILNKGTLSVENSTVSDSPGGGISNAGTLFVDKSTFCGNGVFTNSPISNAGQLIVKNSLFFNNHGFGSGGIENHGGAFATIKHAILLAEQCRGNRRHSDFGTMTVTNSEFPGNHDFCRWRHYKRWNAHGKAQHVLGQAGAHGRGWRHHQLRHREFIGNEAGGWGGGLIISSGTTTIHNSEITK